MEGGFAGQTVGWYAPGRRYPLLSSVLMTACMPVSLVCKGHCSLSTSSRGDEGCVFVADADCLLAVGGAQAVAALAHGVGVKPCVIIVGPGNQYVTAAKSIVNGLWRPV